MENQAVQLPELKVEAKNLPSRGLCYPESTVFSYTNYTFGDYHAASNSDSTPQQVLRKALDGIKINSPMKKEDIGMIDLFMIGLLRRVTSQKDLSFEIEYVCEKCGHKSTLMFSAKDVKFEGLNEAVSALPAKIKIAGKDLHFGVLTVQNALDAAAGMKVDGKKVNSEFAMLASTVKNIGFEEAYKHLNAVVDPTDFAKLDKIGKLMYMQINPLKAVCKNKDEGQACGHTNSINLEGRENLIRPFLESKDTDTDEIRFGDT